MMGYSTNKNMDVNNEFDNVTLYFINGSRELVDYNNMINVFNSRDEDDY